MTPLRLPIVVESPGLVLSVLLFVVNVVDVMIPRMVLVAAGVIAEQRLGRRHQIQSLGLLIPHREGESVPFE